ncbi:hypothetical protein BDW22DRAFT_2862 [Trametopsis cervina]|nr:hypothetical protein BDW22DRAFT_2862 [Trametopsis cervina]
MRVVLAQSPHDCFLITTLLHSATPAITLAMADLPYFTPPQPPLGTGNNPLYVISRSEPDTGWHAVQSGMKEFEKAEIQGFKEDMDALLVFIGLFCAVLTGFIVISYTSLQANTAGLMLLVMTHVSIQAASYSFHDGFLNSTMPAPTSLPAFEPTHNAIIVNILWTASLIVSLAAASFAMLVKQWLRQSSFIPRSSAVHEMRIRYSRRRALEDWQVFEITDILPLLQHISFALFFAGLCYFTADVHSSVENTAFLLVSAWAFFFISATIFPVFSPQCPYKIPALGPFTDIMHKKLRLLGIKTVQRLLEIKIVQKFIRTENRTCSSGEMATTASNSKDMEILLYADKAIDNDDVVDAAISQAVTQSKPQWQEAVTFTQRLIANRLPAYKPRYFNGVPSHLDLVELTPRALAAIHNLLSYVEEYNHHNLLLHATSNDANEDKRPAFWAIFLRLSVFTLQPFTIPRWLEVCDNQTCTWLAQI